MTLLLSCRCVPYDFVDFLLPRVKWFCWFLPAAYHITSLISCHCVPYDFVVFLPLCTVWLCRLLATDFHFWVDIIRGSEFLIATCKKKKTDRLSVCPDVRLILVLVLGRQIVYGQNTVYLCLSKYIVFENTQQYKHHVVRSIARSGVSPPCLLYTSPSPRD